MSYDKPGKAFSRCSQKRRHHGENSLTQHARNNGVGVFRLHQIIGFADDLVPLKMTEF
jgi:hypothetical protein